MCVRCWVCVYVCAARVTIIMLIVFTLKSRQSWRKDLSLPLAAANHLSPTEWVREGGDGGLSPSQPLPQLPQDRCQQTPVQCTTHGTDLRCVSALFLKRMMGVGGGGGERGGSLKERGWEWEGGVGMEGVERGGGGPMPAGLQQVHHSAQTSGFMLFYPPEGGFLRLVGREGGGEVWGGGWRKVPPIATPAHWTAAWGGDSKCDNHEGGGTVIHRWLQQGEQLQPSHRNSLTTITATIYHIC